MAKKTVALSNTKEIGLAMQMYVNDYDDTTPIVFSINSQGSVDVYQTMQRYIKNMDIFFSSEWNLANGASVGSEPASCDNTKTPPGYHAPTGQNATRCVGYGYNWGFGVWAGGALLGPEQGWQIGGASGSVTPGIGMTSIDNPAGLAAFGDAYNGRRYTMCAVGSIIEYYTGAQHNSDLRYGGSFNFAYTDGHAKSMPMQVYNFPNPAALSQGEATITMPANTSLWHSFWCSLDSVNVDPSNFEPGLPTSMGCSQFIDLVFSGGLGFTPTPWPN